ncbi:hypothetical protein C447_08498 [Halococcus hamelinensis 100A6]|uniref:Uncharacterized protein n=1 Tax=Halococcus hamelinensis 100A6 TaxID=1132509 RepID=M0M086_9EURY|nr:hypothetical protein C447_08498 [Halococcus hamelinensis 100A6]
MRSSRRRGIVSVEGGTDPSSDSRPERPLGSGSGPDHDRKQARTPQSSPNPFEASLAGGWREKPDAWVRNRVAYAVRVGTNCARWTATESARIPPRPVTEEP